MKPCYLVAILTVICNRVSGDEFCRLVSNKYGTGPDDIYKDGPDTFGMRIGLDYAQRMKLVNDIVKPSHPDTIMDTNTPSGQHVAFFTDSRKNYTLYVTDGKKWRTYELPNVTDTFETEPDPFPHLEEYFKQYPNPHSMAVTQLSNGQYLATFKMSSTYSPIDSHHQLLINRDRTVNSTLNLGKQLLPTSMLSLFPINDTHDRLLTFYQDVWSYRDYSLANDIPISLSLSIDYRSAEDFKGCKPQFGCDARLDGATTDGPDYRLYRGEYYGQTPILDSSSYKKSNLPRIDAIDRLEASKSTIVMYGNECSFFKNGHELNSKKCKVNGVKIYETASVDAIFNIPNTGVLFLIVGSLYYEYSEEANAELTYMRSGLVSNLWQGLPSKVDSATYLNGKITFFVENFIFYGEVARMKTSFSVTGPTLSRDIILASRNDEMFCFTDHAEYTNITVHNFKQYKNQFKPVVKDTSSETKNDKRHVHEQYDGRGTHQ
ncbi:hypothetical protein HDE_13268 [Halotydeus destructor]|nr:hypothetical protein HDE_13268 [Halotydeus destructor]